MSIAGRLAPRTRLLHLALLAAATALAMLGKGPLGLIPIAVIATALVLGRGTLGLGWRYFGWAAVATLIGAAAFAAWAWAANDATHGQYLELFLGKHVWARSTQALESHGGNSLKYFLYLPYYLPVVAIGFFPWAMFLPGAISATVGGRLGGRVDGRTSRAVLAGMVLPVFVSFSLVATKLPHYVLTLMPGLALATAAVLTAAWRRQIDARDLQWMRRGVAFLGPIGIVGGLGAIVAPWFIPWPGPEAGGRGMGVGLRGGVAIMGVVLLIGTAAAMLWVRQTRSAPQPTAGAGTASAPSALLGLPTPPVGLLLICMVMMELVFAMLVASPLERQFKPVRELAGSLCQAVPADAPLSVCGFEEPSLVFYAQRHMEVLRRKDLPGWFSRSGPGVLVLTEDRLAMLAIRMNTWVGRANPPRSAPGIEQSPATVTAPVATAATTTAPTPTAPTATNRPAMDSIRPGAVVLGGRAKVIDRRQGVNIGNGEKIDLVVLKRL